MTTLEFTVVGAVAVLWGFSTWHTRRHKDRLANPKTNESIRVKEILESIDESLMSELQHLIGASKRLEAVKQLRRAIPGTGFQEAMDTLDQIPSLHPDS